MKKLFLMFPLFLLAALILTVSASASEGLRRMEIVNRNDTDGVFSCGVKLFGGQIQGQVFAVLFAESGQMKRASVYPANETVQVALPDVSGTDYIKIMWMDGRYAPLASPAILRMSENGSLAYAKFMEEFLKLQEEYGGNGSGAASGSDDPYILARLLVSCAELPDLSAYNVVAMLEGPDNLYVLQFNTAEEAKNCAEYLRTFPTVRYVEPDSVMQADSAELLVAAAMDSGVEMSHPLLKERLIPGYDFIKRGNIPQSDYGHGSHISDIISDCRLGMNVNIMPVRTLDTGNVINKRQIFFLCTPLSTIYVSDTFNAFNVKNSDDCSRIVRRL